MNDKSKISKISINGPFNYIKLENNSNKIVHIFFDIHTPLHIQSECDDDESVNIDKYLSKLFKTTKKNIDFFFETAPYEKKTNNNFNKIYISKIFDLFSEKKNKLNENIKFHYIDIRYFFYYDKIMYNIETFLNNFFENCFHESDINHRISSIKYNLNLLNDTNNYLYKILDIYNSLTNKNIHYNKVDLTKFNSQIFDTELQNNYIIQILTKLMKKHKNNNNKIIINKIIKKHFIDNIASIIDEISKLVDIINSYLLSVENNDGNIKICKCFNDILTISFTNCIDNLLDIQNEIKKKINNINIAIISTISKIQDIYFIKRFIEKDYITNAITYTGADHSIMFVYILVKYFNFSITECFYVNKNLLKKNSLEEINNAVLKANHEIYLCPYFYLNYFEKQCISINPI
jgi:hypothetical protein